MPELWKERIEIARKYREWLPIIAAAVQEVLGEAEIYVFGSVAEGRAVLSSDIDILIVTDRKEVAKRKKRVEFIAKIEEKAGLPFIHPFEFHLMTEDEFKEWVEVFRPKLLRVSGLRSG